MDGFGYATNFPAGDITSPAIIARHQNCVNAASCADNSASSVTVCDDPETNRPMLYPDKRLPTPKQQSVCFSDELSVAAAVKPDDVTKGSFPCLVNGSPVFAERKNSTGTLNNHSSQDAVQRSSPSKTSADTNQQPVCNKGFDAETMQSDIKPVDGAVVTATNDTQRTSPKVLHVQFLNGQPCTPLNGNHVDGKSLGSPITPLCSSSSSSSSSSSDDDSSLDFATTRRPVPPDGGWGWVIVAAAFCVNLIADGLSFSFGVIFVDFLDYFGDGKSRTAWIGSLFMGMPLLSGPVASFLTDRYGCRRVTIAGAILAASGFALSSCANSINQLLLTFGVLAGFGLSLCYVAAVVIVAYYFDRKRSLATGLSVCGSGIGTFLFAPLTQMLIDEYGWRGTMLILAGIFLNMAVCGALMRDLPWTVDLAKAKARDRKQARRRMRVRNAARAAGSSAESFTASNSTNTYSQLQPLTNAVACENEDCAVSDCKDPHNTSDAIVPSVPRQFSSLVNLPTYVRNGDSVPLETLELLSTHRDAFDLLLLHHYPGLRMVGSRSFSDSGRLNEDHRVQPLPVVTEKHLRALEEADLKDESKKHALLKPANGLAVGGSHDTARAWWPARKTQSNVTSPTGNLDNVANKRLQASYLKDLRVHRHSLTYRGAMLNINRYRLRASSCPDIYRNSMTTIAREQYDNWPWDGLWEFWDLLRDMLDLSHFADTRYLFFALSNFLLYMWYDVMYIYLADNAIGMGVSEQDASMLLSVIGILNMVGEIFLGWAGDMPWMNAGLVYALCMCLCGAATAIVPLMSDYIGLCVASGAFGLFIAANYSLTSIILVELITLERFTNAYGLLLLVQGIANLVGPPLAGWIGDITGSYDLSFYLAGLFIALSGAVLVVIPLVTVLKKCQKSQRAKVDLEGCANNKTANHHGAKKEVVYINALHPVAKKSSANDGFLGCFTKETNKGLTDNGIHV